MDSGKKPIISKVARSSSTTSEELVLKRPKFGRRNIECIHAPNEEAVKRSAALRAGATTKKIQPKSGGAGMKQLSPMKKMKGSSYPKPTPKPDIVGYTKLNGPPASCSIRPVRLAGGETKPAASAEELDKKTNASGTAEKCKNAKSNATTSSVPTIGLKGEKNPMHTVTDFQKEIQDALRGCLKTVQEQVGNKGRLNIDDLQERLENEQAQRLGLLFDRMNSLGWEANTSEQFVEQCKQELSNAKHFAEVQEREMYELRNAHASQMIAQEKALKTECDAEVAKKNDEIDYLTEKLKAVQKSHDTLEQCLQSFSKEHSAEKREHASLVTEIVKLNNTMATLTERLQHDAVAHEITVHELSDRNEEIAKLKSKLEHRERLYDQILDELHETAREGKELKASYAQVKKDYATLEENLNAARKELQEIHDCRADVERYQAQIKKLKQDSLEKDIELEGCSRNAEQYAREISQLKHSNSKLNRQIEKLKTDRTRSERTTNRYDLKAISAECGLKKPLLSPEEHETQLMKEHIERLENVNQEQAHRIASLEEEVNALKQILKQSNIAYTSSEHFKRHM